MAFVTVFTYSSEPSVYAKEQTVVQEKTGIKQDSDGKEDFLELQQEYIEETEAYSDRYIIWRKDGLHINESSLIDTAKDAYDDGAADKKKRENQWKIKLKKADAQSYKQWNEARENQEENNSNSRNDVVCNYIRDEWVYSSSRGVSDWCFGDDRRRERRIFEKHTGNCRCEAE